MVKPILILLVGALLATLAEGNAPVNNQATATARIANL
jgi:hypothetical protein